MYDAAVIGAGPAGSRVACGLAEKGYRVIVLEKKQDTGEPVCCTGIIGIECIERFGIDDNVVYRKVNGAKIVSPSGKEVHVQRPEPQAAIVDRGALNASLAQRALETGAEYCLNRRVTNLDVKNDRVEITMENDRTADERLEARVAVIAGGYGTKLVEQAGLRKAADFAMGVQTEVETDGKEEVEVYLGGMVAPGFFAWLVPTTPGHALAGLITRRSTSYYMDKFLTRLAGEGKISGAAHELRFASLALNRATRTSGKRVLVVGSAAGQVKPVTGGGVYYGMLCADMAAETLATALEHDDLTAVSLANYDKQWGRLLGREIRLGYWSRKFYERLSDRRIETIFDITIKNHIDTSLAEADNLRFDWHGAVVMELLKQKALSGIFRAIKAPFPAIKRD